MFDKQEGDKFPEFARRLSDACDAIEGVPTANTARAVWLAFELRNRFDLEVKETTVRAWLDGRAKPNVKQIAALAEIARVSASQLTQALKVVHPEFARRVTLACEGNTKVPPLNFGRLGWFVKQFEDRFGEPVTVETIRKWFAGESRPRPNAMAGLAQILEVDEAWLAVGKTPEVSPKQQKVRNATAEGAVNLIVGLIQMAGGHPAFPAENDSLAQHDKIDFYAVIKGAQYRIHVALAQSFSDGLSFAIPVEAVEGAFVIGLLPTGELTFKLYELDRENVEAKATRKGDAYRLPVGAAADFREITSFANRL